MQRRGMLLLLAGVAGCASPPSSFFTLAAVPGTVVAIRPQTIQLRRVTVPGYLDQPQIMRVATANRLDLSSLDRWASPFDQMIGRVLQADLDQRLPEANIINEQGAVSGSPELLLEVDVQRFDADLTGVVTLTAQIGVRPGSGSKARPVTRLLRLTEQAANGGTSAATSAMSVVLGRLADAAATMLAQAR